MTFKKQSWEPVSMIDALQNGIGMVVQESGTISGVTVAEDVYKRQGLVCAIVISLFA